MLKPAILALIRQILTVAGTALVAKGLVQASDIEPVIGALLTIGSVIWSVADKGGGRTTDSMPASTGGKAAQPQVLTPHGPTRKGGRDANTKPLFCAAQSNAGVQGERRAGQLPC